MGQRAVEFFREAERIGGLAAKAQLASLARVTSTEAAVVADTPELLSRIEEALAGVRTLRARRASLAPAADGSVVASGAGAREAKLLRKQMRSVAELMSQRAVFLGDVHATARRVNEVAASVMDIERVSVWLLDEQRSKITCVDLFERKSAIHSAGIVLSRKDFEPYFGALETERTIAAHDAQNDTRTACFTASYLRPLNIKAMLDVPISVSGNMVGVVCHEHVGSSRRWNEDDEAFAYLMSTTVALAMERR